jgi:hypothetical protein
VWGEGVALIRVALLALTRLLRRLDANGWLGILPSAAASCTLLLKHIMPGTACCCAAQYYDMPAPSVRNALYLQMQADEEPYGVSAVLLRCAVPVCLQLTAGACRFRGCLAPLCCRGLILMLLGRCVCR